MTQQVEANQLLLAHLVLELEDGSIAESTRLSGKPTLLRLGDNSLSEALEARLLGMKIGEKRRFKLSPDQAFGVSEQNNIQTFGRRAFMQTGIPEPGTIMAFTARDGSEMAGVIREVNDDSVIVDFNHPLAGWPVIFDIELIAINPSLTESEGENANIVS